MKLINIVSHTIFVINYLKKKLFINVFNLRCRILPVYQNHTCKNVFNKKLNPSPVINNEKNSITKYYKNKSMNKIYSIYFIDCLKANLHRRLFVKYHKIINILATNCTLHIALWGTF